MTGVLAAPVRGDRAGAVGRDRRCLRSRRRDSYDAARQTAVVPGRARQGPHDRTRDRGRVALPRRGARRRPGSRGGSPGSGSETGAERVRRSAALEGKRARGPGPAVDLRRSRGSSIRTPPVSPRAAVRRHRRDHPGGRHRRQCGNLLGPQRHHPAAPAVPEIRAVGVCVHTMAAGRPGASPDIATRIPGIARGQPVICRDRGVYAGRGEPHRGRPGPAGAYGQRGRASAQRSRRAGGAGALVRSRRD